ncbi:ParB/RepB/Spo0J family partition protein [Phycicoccus sonneratiae]|uniref:ParB N-terminal domain-containing protein n=1 Tax=Phycicoccus sonneratiae TaxID=2807628 RepID=A0ABS2CQK0_9MICO|nr:ParB N-terminal domain-containing protein [Phycicoccus sonneraticus]MBM6402162.1 ParB N-terminal domain-containing protein [Phycicoccus sonneraticus]
MSTTSSTTYETGHSYRVPPQDLTIGTNVRTDTHPAASDFAASIKARGVLEPITVWVDDNGDLVVYRGQRRTLAAVKVGTPDGLVPVHVVARPEETDRVIDQLVENVHRAPMREAEERDAIEQLALLGVSAAQIVKRTAIARPTVDAVLTIAGSATTKSRMDTHGLTLAQAAIFAEFEGDLAATESLEQAVSWGRPLEHTAQRLRDARAEAHAVRAEADRLRDQGMPALDPDEVPERTWPLRLDGLVTADGEPVPEADWPNVPGAAVVVRAEWAYPDEDDTEDSDADGEPVLRFVPVWICTEPAAAGLRSAYDQPSPTGTTSPGESEAGAEDRAEQRREVITNNKAWRSAETVRREWLAQFVTRKAVPAGAEALICESILSGQYSLTKAMSDSHRMLRTLLGETEQEGDLAGSQACARLAANATTAKAATVRTLAAVLAAWEASTSVHTWRNPSEWDARIMTALTGWGYQPSEVEQLLLGADADHAA